MTFEQGVRLLAYAERAARRPGAGAGYRRWRERRWQELEATVAARRAADREVGRAAMQSEWDEDGGWLGVQGA